MADKHIHKWHCHAHRTDMLICQGCNTVTKISVLVDNTAAKARKEEQLDILTRQLYARQLKKTAHDKAYQWVRKNSRGFELPVEKQGALL